MYEELAITTNKSTIEERRGIPHHLLGCVPLGEDPWTVRQFHAGASKIIENIRSRGKLPILVGGTHYYLQSLLFPKSLLERGELEEHTTEEEEARKWPILATDSKTMLEELRRVDPVIAERWHPGDRRKIRRSLHIWLQTGRRASDVYQEQTDPSSNRRSESRDDSAFANHDEAPQLHDPLIFWTFSSPPVLEKRLEQRVDSMVSNGLLEEVQSMHRFCQTQAQQGKIIDRGRGVWIAIGYKEMLPYITNPTPSNKDRDECIHRTKMSTKQYAKRQNRWIRLKLLPAAKEAGIEKKLFLLDGGSNPSTNVETVAGDLTSAFLAGETLPEPEGLSDAARAMLPVEAKERCKSHYCKACDKTVMSDRQWLAHVESKGHKNAVRPKVDWKALYPKPADSS